MASALDPSPPRRRAGQYPIAGLIRRARRIADMSQRQMARFAKVSPATVGRVEAGTMTPSVDVLERMLGAAGLYLAVIDQDGRVILPMEDWDDTRDGAERRYPSHLDTILDPEPGEWWADKYGLARPPETLPRLSGGCAETVHQFSHINAVFAPFAVGPEAEFRVDLEH